jgi:hypothetical protein
MKHRLYITWYIFIAYVYELKGENYPSSFFIPPQALSIGDVASNSMELSTSWEAPVRAAT